MKQASTNRNTLKSAPLLIALAAAALPGLPRDAIAVEDGKLYPGTFCTGQYGPLADRSSIRFNPDGSVSNLSTVRAAGVQCLEINDITGNLDQVSVYYTDRHASEKVSCYARTHLSNETRTIVSQAGGASPAGRHAGVFTIRDLEPSSRSYKYFMLSCSIPPRTAHGESAIHAVRVIEYD